MMRRIFGQVDARAQAAVVFLCCTSTLVYAELKRSLCDHPTTRCHASEDLDLERSGAYS